MSENENSRTPPGPDVADHLVDSGFARTATDPQTLTVVMKLVKRGQLNRAIQFMANALLGSGLRQGRIPKPRRSSADVVVRASDGCTQEVRAYSSRGGYLSVKKLCTEQDIVSAMMIKWVSLIPDVVPVTQTLVRLFDLPEHERGARLTVVAQELGRLIMAACGRNPNDLEHVASLPVEVLQLPTRHLEDLCVNGVRRVLWALDHPNEAINERDT